MKRTSVWLTAVVVLLFGAATWFKLRPRGDAAGTEAARPATAQEARIREFWEVYRRATNERIAGNTKAAAESYAQALELNQEHEDALYYLGNMHLELGRHREAEATWEKLVAVNPQSSRAFSRLGDLHFCAEPGAPLDLARAEADFRRAHDINQEETGPVLHLAEIALVRGDLPSTRRYLDAVIGANAGSVEAHFLKSYLAWREGAPGEAAALFARAVELARPPAPAAGASGEGDTKRGSAPMVAPGARCRAFEPEVALLKAPPGSDPSAGMEAQYQRLDQRIEEFRRFRP